MKAVSKKRLQTLLAVALLGVGVAPSLAAEGKIQGTINYAVNHLNSENLGGTSVLSRDEYKGILELNNASSPLHKSLQDCLGSFVVDPVKGPPIQNNGFCDGVDRDGDVFWMWYHDEESLHTWSFMGGTGKFQNLRGEEQRLLSNLVRKI